MEKPCVGLRVDEAIILRIAAVRAPAVDSVREEEEFAWDWAA